MLANWDSYFCNVNNVLASIALNLELHKHAPDSDRPNLLWVWVYMKSPREDGLSAQSEFEDLCSIEDQLTTTMLDKFDAVFCGRITTDGRREFYYYAPRAEQLKYVIKKAMDQFRGYEFDCGWKPDSGWTQYLEVLYPSDEVRQCMENRKVLDVLEQKGDSLERPRDVLHWIYFRTDADREQFRVAVAPLRYRLESKSDREHRDFPKGICIARLQSVKPAELDDAVIELFRLAKKHSGDYDGWETQVISQ